MTTNETCPHCGAAIKQIMNSSTWYECHTVIWWAIGAEEVIGDECYKHQLAAKDAEIERLRQAVLDEREACAAECRNWWKAEDCEKAILARNVTPKV